MATLSQYKTARMEPSDIQGLQECVALTHFERRLWLKKNKDWSAPRFVYKFRTLEREDTLSNGGANAFQKESISRLRTLVVDCMLFLSSPRSFNDPFDMTARVIVEATAEQKRNRFEQLPEDAHPDFRESYIELLMEEDHETLLPKAQSAFDLMINEFGVCCFVASKPDNILMWSHYGGQHSGVCLQFECARDPNVFGRLLPVMYRDTYPAVNWITNDGGGISLLAKYRAWAYENEQRLILGRAAGSFVPYNPEALTRVIVGCRADEQTRTALSELLAERKAAGHPLIEVLHAQRAKSEYRLRFYQEVD